MKIRAVGRYLPERVVTAAELAPRIGVSEEWIVERTGVSERRWVDTETPLQMALGATREALDRASMEPEDLDLIIYASATPHQLIPDTAALVQRELALGSSGVKCFSVHSTCLSFFTALDITSSYFDAGRHDNVLVVSSEIASRGIDFDEPESASLLGDMATAVIIGRGDSGSGSGLRSLVLHTYGDGADLCRMEVGYAHHPLDPATKDEHYRFHMDGPEVFRMAYRLFPPIVLRALQDADVALSDLALVVPHQASLLAVRSIQRAMGMKDEQVVLNLDRFGNCVAASLPGALYDASVHDGDLVLLAGTGAGVSMGAAVLEW